MTMRTRHPLVLAGVVLLTTAVHAQGRVELPAVGPNPDRLRLADALYHVARLELSPRDAVWVVRRAGRQPGAPYAAELKGVAAFYASVSDLVALNALQALWEGGEPVGYFELLALDLDRDPDLAAAAIWILARNPTPALGDTLRVKRVTSPTLNESIQAYLALLEGEGRCDAYPIGDQLDFLLLGWFDLVGSCDGVEDALEGYPHPFWVHFGSRNGELDPEVHWSRREFLELAAEYPAAAAEALDGFSALAAVGSRCPETAADLGDRFADYVREVAFPDGPPSGESPPRAND